MFGDIERMARASGGIPIDGEATVVDELEVVEAAEEDLSMLLSTPGPGLCTSLLFTVKGAVQGAHRTQGGAGNGQKYPAPYSEYSPRRNF